MAGEDQERLEDYLEMERYISELQAGRVAHPPDQLTPGQTRIYQMVALLRAAHPDATTPRPEFVEALRDRLLAMESSQDFEDQEATLKLPKLPKAPKVPVQRTSEAVTEPPLPPLPVLQEQEEQQEQQIEETPPPVPVEETPPPAERKGKRRWATFVSRRNLLTRGAAAAASLAVGVGTGMAVSRATSSPASVALSTPTPTPDPSRYPMPQPLIPGGPTVRHFVATLDQLGEDAIKFATDSVVGYIIRNDGDNKQELDKGPVIAVSATCTHMGCLIHWDGKDRNFHCPCHGGMFSEYGMPVNSGPLHYLVPLPRLEVFIDKADGNKIYVEVPASKL